MKIDTARLSRLVSKTGPSPTIICHRNGPNSPCPDGTASAILLCDLLPEARLYFFAHQETELEDFEPRPNTIFCDVTPPLSRVEAWKPYEPIVLDHHVTAKPVVEALGGIFGENSKQESGAVLAYQHVWLPLVEEMSKHVRDTDLVNRNGAHHFAMLAGIRDTWAKDDPWWLAACQQAAALHFIPWEMWSGTGFYYGPFYKKLQQLLEMGTLLYAKKQEAAKLIASQALHFHVHVVHPKRQIRVAVTNSLDTSDAADLLLDDDILVGFAYLRDKGDRWIFKLSFRSRNDIDVGALAKRMGGGGHPQASGAIIIDGEEHDWETCPPCKLDPYTRIRDLITLHMT